jgi:hypothetical protein
VVRGAPGDDEDGSRKDTCPDRLRHQRVSELREQGRLRRCYLSSEQSGTTDVCVRKVRFKWVGQQGKATVGYDKATGTYSDLNSWKAA